MAKFVGTLQEFHHLIGPRVRNAVNLAASGHRKRLGGICEECGQQAELQSAHIHGRGRRTIIESVLSNYVDDEGIVTCDLARAEKEIIEAHLPIEETFRFLCQPCHSAYDHGVEKPPRAKREPKPKRASSGDDEFLKLGRIELWAKRPHQVNHQIIKAFLLLEEDGSVEFSRLRDYCTQQLHISKFAGNFTGMKTDAGNAHGKVFFEDGSRVRVWEPARIEIDMFFGEGE
jgi:hypothetical protein